MYTNARLEVVATDTRETVLMARTGRGEGEADIIARLTGVGFHGTPEELLANAERLAACWNLCLGIPDKVLADCAVKDNLMMRLDALSKAVRHHDVGLAGLPPHHTKPSNWHG